MAEWTEERRKKQAERIRQSRPWEKSTGPRTARGKKASSLNALKHGLRSKSAGHIKELLRLNHDFVKHYQLFCILLAQEGIRANELIKNAEKSVTDPGRRGKSGNRTKEKPCPLNLS